MLARAHRLLLGGWLSTLTANQLCRRRLHDMGHKGKKHWRKTIDTAEVDAALTKKELETVALSQAPDNQLFFLDTEHDDGTAHALARGSLLKKAKKGPKLLKCQVILNAAHNAKAVNPAASKPRKSKGPAFKKPHSKLDLPKTSKDLRLVQNAEDSTSNLDLWHGNDISQQQQESHHPEARKPQIKAVEIDAPGCSFNPDYEQHQDSVAEAVAAEMNKIYEKEHVPRGPRIFDHMPDIGDLEALLDTGGNDEAEDEVGDPSLEIDTLDNVPTVHRRQEKKTQTDRNRQKRQRDADLAAQEKQELKKQRRELDRVKNISQEIATLENARTAQATRKAVVKAEKALTAPPKLSKHKFQPANVQVLLSEEIDGSLRRLKGTPFLAKDRFKTFQKRGVIEPRVRIEKPSRRKAITYQTGDRLERAVMGDAEAKALVKKNAAVKKPGKPKLRKKK